MIKTSDEKWSAWIIKSRCAICRLPFVRIQFVHIVCHVLFVFQRRSCGFSAKVKEWPAMVWQTMLCILDISLNMESANNILITNQLSFQRVYISHACRDELRASWREIFRCHGHRALCGGKLCLLNTLSQLCGEHPVSARERSSGRRLRLTKIEKRELYSKRKMPTRKGCIIQPIFVRCQI